MSASDIVYSPKGFFLPDFAIGTGFPSFAVLGTKDLGNGALRGLLSLIFFSFVSPANAELLMTYLMQRAM
jgi:hypothetical protein